MTEKRYLFFLRHFNDIDNITPVVFFFLSESERNHADIIFYYEDLPWERDINLRFLLDRFPRQLSVSTLPRLVPRKKSTVLRRTWKSLLRSVRKRLSLPYDDGDDLRRGKLEPGHVKAILRQYVQKTPFPCLAVFDLVRVQMVKGLLDGLRDSGVTSVVCLPVSPLINFNVMRADWMTDPRAESFQQELNYSEFDAVGFVDSFFVKSVSTLQEELGIETPWLRRTAFLGSARYCRQWLAVRQRFVPSFPNESKKKKIVIFPSRAQSNVFWQEFQRVVGIASRHTDTYDIVVKQHPRMRTELNLPDTTNVRYENDADSSALIDWADAVMFWSSSVALEGYAKGKFMVCMDYLVANRTVYSEFSAGYIARSRDDVELFFLRFAHSPEKLPYEHRGIDDLLNNVVYAAGPDVPEIHLDFLRRNATSEFSNACRDP
jgi:hypothetical protein